MAAREFTIGADDTATTGVPANTSAPLAGKKVKVPVYADPADGPKAFVEFANSLPKGGIELDPTREDTVIQADDDGAGGFKWTEGMAFYVVTAVPDDKDGKVGDVAFVVD